MEHFLKIVTKKKKQFAVRQDTAGVIKFVRGVKRESGEKKRHAMINVVKITFR